MQKHIAFQQPPFLTFLRYPPGGVGVGLPWLCFLSGNPEKAGAGLAL